MGVSVVNPALFASWVGSSGNSTLTASDVSVDFGALLDSANAYYVEIVEGSTGMDDVYVGQRFEVDVATTMAGATADGVIAIEMDSDRTTWVNDPPTTPTTAPVPGGYRFELRAHMTLGQVFDPSSLHASTSFADADQIQFYNGGGFTIYYVLGNAQFAQWTKQVGSFDSMDNFPIAPGEGMIFKRSSLSPSTANLRVQGVARMTPFVQPMNSGFNFVAEAFLASHSFDSRDAYPGDFNSLDRVQIYNGTGFDTYLLYTDGQDTHLWVDSVDGEFTEQNLTKVFDYRGAVFVDIDSQTSSYRIDPPYPPYAPQSP